MISFLIKFLIGLVIVCAFIGVWFTSRVEHSPNQALFLAGKIPDPSPDGFYKGTVANLPVASWLGKKFNAVDSTGINVFKSGADQYPFKTYIAKGIRDKDLDVLAIDYNTPANPLWLRPVLDEIVEVTQGQYLGKLQVRLFKGYSFSILYFNLTK